MTSSPEAARPEDVSALAWVHGELRKSLETAHKALRRYLRDAEEGRGSDVDAVDPSVLRNARVQLHQGVGALEIVGLPLVAQVLRASESAVQGFIAKPQTINAEGVEAVERASFAVLDFLARRLADKPVRPLELFPQYEAVQAVAGAARVHPADLWPHDWQWHALPAEAGVASRAISVETRDEMEALALALLRRPDASTQRAMSDLCAELGAGAEGDAATTWKLGAAVLEALATERLAPDLYTKRVASRLLGQLRLNLRGTSEATDVLAHELLFFCVRAAEAGSDAPRLAAVHAVWPRDRDAACNYGESRLGRLDPALSSQAKRRVASAKDVWSAIAAGEMHRMPVVNEAFSLLAESIERLFPGGADLAKSLTQASRQVVASGEVPAPALAMEVATGLLYVEASLEDGEFDDPRLDERVRRLAARVDHAAGGGEPDDLETWMEELYRRISDRQTMGSVVQELRASLSEAEKLIDGFFRDPTRRDMLQPVPGQLSAMRGVLSVLGLDHAAQATVHMRGVVDELSRVEVDPETAAATFDALADNLGALGFLIDMLSVQPQLAKTLFSYDATTGSLRAVVGQVSRLSGLGAPAPTLEPTAAPDVAAPQPAPRAPVAAPAPAPVAAPASGLEDDAEMREIFLEEAAEVIQAARASLDQLRQQPADLAEMTSLRRAFHTLKGSSRMVGLTDFGEAAWSCEQLFNARLADHRAMDHALEGFSAEALDYLSGWAAAIAAQRDDGHRSAPVTEAATALRVEGRRVVLAPPSVATEALAIEATVVLEPRPDDDASTLAARVPDLPSAADLDLALFADVPETPAAVEAEVPAADGLELSGPLLEESPESVATTEPPAGEDEALAPSVPAADEAVEFEPTVPAPIEAPVVGAPTAADGPPGMDFELDLGEMDLVEPAPAPQAPSQAPPADDLAAGTDFDLDFGELAPDTAAAPASEPPTEEPAPADAEAGGWAEAGPPPAPEVVERALSDDDLAAFDLPPQVEETPSAAVPAEGQDAPDEAWPDAGVESLGVAAEDAAVAPAGEAGAAAEAEAEPQAEAAPELAEDPTAAQGAPEGVDAASEPTPEPEPTPELAPEPEPEPEPVAASEAVDDEQVKVVGPLRISIPLFNIYLNEADEQSRRLVTELAEWSLEHERPVSETAIALAHSLAGNSATVGFGDLSVLARSLEHALMRSQAIGHGAAEEPALFNDVAQEVRRLLHQFAAGFLKPVNPELMARLAEHEVAHALDKRGSEFDVVDTSPGDLDEALPVVVPPLPMTAMELAEDEIDATDRIDSDLFPIFEEEADELLPQLRSRLSDWARRPADPGAGLACMRTLHTFKGGARLAGAMRVGEMAHRLESAIEKLTARGHARVADIDDLMGRADAMAVAFERLRLPTPVAPAPAAPAAAPAPAQAPAPLPAATAPDTVAPMPDRRAGVPAAIEWSRFAVDAPLPPLEAAPETAASATATGTVRVRASLLDRLVNQAGEVSITRARIEADARALQTSLAELTDNLDRLRRQLRDIELQAETQIASRIEAARASAETFDSLEMDRFTRFQELTRMMAESVNDVATVQRGLQRAVQSTEDELAAQARLTRDLQDDLLRTRMVEFESLADRLYRVVRQAGKDSGKAVALDLVGGSIEVDRGVLERMIGPFEHLLRNAVAHGIEDAAGRRAAGKDATGAITLMVTQEGNEVGVEIGDDGAGLDLARIRRSAVAQGRLAETDEVSDAELARLIFQPGVSTAETVTELAGRGVGMDIVRAEVDAMGGRIEVHSERGRGTRIRILLPLTTAVTQVVMLRVDDLRVAVPSTLVEIVQRVLPHDIAAHYAGGSMRHGDETVPFYWLGALLQAGAAPPPSERAQTVVIIRSAAQRVALHVDEVIGNQEVVVKHLGPQLSRLPGLAGITLLPSGAVALIYNPVALATVYGAAARQRPPEAAVLPDSASAGPTAPAEPAAALAPLVMVVDDSLTVRRVTQRLLVREGYRVVLAKDGLEAVTRLADERPAVLLSDIEMPRMDGFDLVRNVRGDPRLQDLPVIMITSRIAQKHRDYAAELGVDHYLGKPYSEEQLLALVAGFVRAQLAS